MESRQLKNFVKEKYGELAILSNKSSCCGTPEPCGELYNIMGDDYTRIEGYIPDADLGLGCGIPTDKAGICKGETVLDLGSGAGNDVFIASRIVGENGRVIGLDMTGEMIEKARSNCVKLGFDNVDFILGEIEDIPLPNSSVDVVLSNCVLNLVPDKSKAFSEISRVLKDKGRFCISDIVLEGDLPESIRNAAAWYSGCISGALPKEEYLDIIKKSGFANIKILSSKTINIPSQVLEKYLSLEELDKFGVLSDIISSITVYAEK